MYPYKVIFSSKICLLPEDYKQPKCPSLGSLLNKSRYNCVTEHPVSAELNGEVFYVLYGKISKILSKNFNEQKNMHYTPAFALKWKQGKRITMFIFVSKEIFLELRNSRDFKRMHTDPRRWMARWEGRFHRTAFYFL